MKSCYFIAHSKSFILLNVYDLFPFLFLMVSNNFIIIITPKFSGQCVYVRCKYRAILHELLRIFWAVDHI